MMTKTIQERMQEKILILDGAMGTMIQRLSLTAEDFGGEEYDGCNEYLVLTRPEVILDIHREYLQAGADIIETDTFGATSVVLAEYGLQHLAREINMAAVTLAKAACSEYSTSDHPRYVAGSIGPTTKTLSVTGGISFDELQDAYFEQAKALVEAGADLLLVETAQDMLNVKAATTAIQAAFAALHTRIPVMVSGTIEAMGTTLAGQTIESFYIGPLPNEDRTDVPFNKKRFTPGQMKRGTTTNHRRAFLEKCWILRIWGGSTLPVGVAERRQIIHVR